MLTEAHAQDICVHTGLSTIVARRTSSPMDRQPVQALLLLDVEFLFGDVIWPHRFPWLHAKLFVEGTHAPFLDVHAWTAWHPLHLDTITCTSQEREFMRTENTCLPSQRVPENLTKRARSFMALSSLRISDRYPMGCQNIRVSFFTYISLLFCTSKIAIANILNQNSM